MKKRSGRHKRCSPLTGFTLIEVLLALAILGVGLASILSLFALGGSSARRAYNNTRAALYAQLTFEDLKRYSISNFSNINSSLQPATFSTPPAEYSDLTRTLVVNLNPYSGLPNYVMVELTISWNNNNRQEKFITYLTRYGP